MAAAASAREAEDKVAVDVRDAAALASGDGGTSGIELEELPPESATFFITNAPGAAPVQLGSALPAGATAEMTVSALARPSLEDLLFGRENTQQRRVERDTFVQRNYEEFKERKTRRSATPAILDRVKQKRTRQISESSPEHFDILKQLWDPHGLSRFGVWTGVANRALCASFSGVLFLRMGFIMGHAGLGYGMLIMVAALLLVALTALSMSAIFSNGRFFGGGIYFGVSRCTGPKLGGAVGMLFMLALAMNTGFLISNMADVLVEQIETNHNFHITGSHGGDVRVSSIFLMLALLAHVRRGLNWTMSVQTVALIVILFVLTCFLGSLFRPAREHEGYYGAFELGSENWMPEWGGETFISIFALYFSSVIGIMPNISGEISDPERDVPRGTFYALFISHFVKMALGIMLGSAVERDAVDAATGLPSGLRNDNLIWARVVFSKPLFYLGVYAATFVGAAANMLGSARILSAMARDQIFPYLGWIRNDRNKLMEPLRGYTVVAAFALCVAMIGLLQTLAPLISCFFLMSYSGLNYACFVTAHGNAIGWRPRFRYFNKWLSLVGALLTLVAAFLVNWYFALVSVVVGISVYRYLAHRKVQANWGSAFDAQKESAAVEAIQRLDRVVGEGSAKNFRPHVLVMTGQPMERPDLVHFAQLLNKSKGIVVLGNVIVAGDAFERLALERAHALTEITSRFFASRRAGASQMHEPLSLWEQQVHFGISREQVRRRGGSVESPASASASAPGAQRLVVSPPASQRSEASGATVDGLPRRLDSPTHAAALAAAMSQKGRKAPRTAPRPSAAHRRMGSRPGVANGRASDPSLAATAAAAAAAAAEAAPPRLEQPQPTQLQTLPLASPSPSPPPLPLRPEPESAPSARAISPRTFEPPAEEADSAGAAQSDSGSGAAPAFAASAVEIELPVAVAVAAAAAPPAAPSGKVYSEDFESGGPPPAAAASAAAAPGSLRGGLQSLLRRALHRDAERQQTELLPSDIDDGGATAKSAPGSGRVSPAVHFDFAAAEGAARRENPALSESLQRHRRLSTIGRTGSVQWLRTRMNKSRPLVGTYEVVVARSIREGARMLVQLGGIGRLRVNTVVLGFKYEWVEASAAEIAEYVDMVREMFVFHMGVLICRNIDRLALQDVGESRRSARGGASDRPPKRIDIWWLADDGGLTLLVPYIIQQHRDWEGSQLRVMTVSSSDRLSTAQVQMSRLMARFRIKAEVCPIVSPPGSTPLPTTTDRYFSLHPSLTARPRQLTRGQNRTLVTADLVRQHSHDAHLIFISLPVPVVGRDNVEYLAALDMLSFDLPPTILMRGNQQTVLSTVL